MTRFYYYVAQIFKRTEPMGTVGGMQVADGAFSPTRAMRSLGDDEGVPARNVVITFFAEVPLEEYQNYKELLQK